MQHNQENMVIHLQLTVFSFQEMVTVIAFSHHIGFKVGSSGLGGVVMSDITWMNCGWLCGFSDQKIDGMPPWLEPL